ncbi:MAG: hypothetical protein IPP17_23685 [Bacteroidetes bacterium]|nr:hypothetical protein [Bacteroidota bacterium]
METMFDILFAGLLILGSILAFAIAYLIQRRPWQRIVVFVLAALLFGTTLVIPDFEGTLLAGLPIAGMLLAFVLGLIGWRIKTKFQLACYI